MKRREAEINGRSPSRWMARCILPIFSLVMILSHPVQSQEILTERDGDGGLAWRSRPSLPLGYRLSVNGFGVLQEDAYEVPDYDAFTDLFATNPHRTEPTEVQYMVYNVGNVSPTAWRFKLTSERVTARIREFIASTNPDVLLLVEVAESCQLNSDCRGGPLLPTHYEARCHANVDREGRLYEPETPVRGGDFSYEHECIAWDATRWEYVPGSSLMVGSPMSHFSFTGFRVDLRNREDGLITRFVSVHTPSVGPEAKKAFNHQVWNHLVGNLHPGSRVIVGGDWNSQEVDLISPPDLFTPDYFAGQHLDGSAYDNEFTAHYIWPLRLRIDHAFSMGFMPYTPGSGQASFVGGYRGEPRADGGRGCDHRHIRVIRKYHPAQLSI